jgi:anaerobic magnesium-protoporphyrin IX monomethyl ester cyclase
MKITLIQPFTDNLEPPLSLAFIAGSLKRAGHTVRIIDLQISDIRRQWEGIFHSERTDLVGITAMTPQIKQAHDIAHQIKQKAPSLPIVAGGVHPTLLPEQTLKEFPSFDLLVIGEGEETIVEVAARQEAGKPIADSSIRGIAYRSGEDIVRTTPRPRIQDLDALPNPHEHYDFDYYLKNNSFGFTKNSVSMIVSRGCPYNCKFCATKNFWTRNYICKSTDGIIREIRHVVERGAEGIVFRDSTFNINRKWIYELCDKIHRENLHFKWAMNARVNLVDYESFHYMKQAGLDTVYFGVESGSQKLLDFYGKGITLKQTEKAFEVCRSLNIHTGAYFMLGALPETREDMEMTYAFVKKLRPTFSLVFIFMPLPGSELYDYYISQGYRFDYSDIRSNKAAFSSAGLTREELETIRAKWYLDFNKKSSLVIRGLNALMEVRSWNDFQRAWEKVSKHLPFRKKAALRA